ncbi:MAG TPA: lantibiotic dehydratase [Ktedonobacteraceae bacterium]
MNKAWTLAPDFILRSTGFPLSWIEPLRFTGTVEAIHRLLAEEQTLARLRTDSQEKPQADWIHDRDAALRWKKLKKSLARGNAIPEEEIRWVQHLEGPAAELTQLNTMLERCLQLEQAARQTFEAEMEEKRRVLREIVADPRFQEAIFLSSPHMFFQGLLPYIRTEQKKRNTESKRLERQLIAYLQRLVGKNETTSFFGPINYGSFDREISEEGAEQDKCLSVRYTYQSALQHRETFMAYWAVQALADAFTAQPAVYPYLTPIRSFLFQLLDSQQVQSGLSQKRQTLAPIEYQVLLLADGRHTIAQLEQEMQREREELRTILQRLADQQLLRLAWEVPVTETRCLEWLVMATEEVREETPEIERWQQGLRRLRQIKDTFSPAALEEKAGLLHEAEEVFQELTGQEAARRGGQMYADRLLFYEECKGHLADLRLEPQAQKDWEKRLAGILHMSALHSLEMKKQQRRFALDVYRELYGDSERPVPYLRFLADVMHHANRERWQQEFAQIQSAIASAVTRQIQALALAGQGKQVTLTSEDLIGLCASPELAGDDPLFCSPDLMFVPATGQLVVGEVHDTVMLWSWALSFHSQAERVQQSMWHLLEETVDCQTINILSSKRLKIAPFEYPGASVQVKARSVSQRHEKRAAADLSVRPGAGRLELLLAGNEEPAQVYNGELHTMTHDWFALPGVTTFRIHTGQHTPRVVIEDVIYQREQWHLTRADLLQPKYTGTSFELFYDLLKMQQAWEMPDYIFVRISGEPKPLMIDFHNFFLLEMWEAFLKEGRTMVVSEMVPAPNQLWLTDREGQTYAAEFRTSAFFRPVQREGAGA